MSKMISLLLLLITVGCGSTHTGFTAKTHYEYLYEGLQKVSMPRLAAQSALLAIRCKVTIQAVTSDLLYVKFHQVEYGEKHGKEPSGDGGSNGINYERVDIQHLEQVFNVHMKDGQVEKILISNNEPEWVVNMKKSVMQMLQMNLNQHTGVIETWQQTNPLTNHPPSGWRYPRMFSVIENGIQGECETVYEVTPYISATERKLTRQRSEDRYRQHRLQHQKPLLRPFTVYKTRNYETCRRRVKWNNRNKKRCHDPEECQENEPQISTQMQYLMDGDATHFTIREVTVNSDVIYQGRDKRASSDTIKTTSQQTLLFLNSLVGKSFSGSIREPIEHRGLNFQCPTRDGRPLLFPDLLSAPQTPHAYPGLPRKFMSTVEVSKKRQCLKDTLKVLDNKLYDSSALQKEDIASLVIKAEQCISFLSYQEIADIEASLKGPFEKQIFYNILALAGSNPAVMFVMRNIEDNRISDNQACDIISALPQQIKTPTKQLVEQLMQLSKSSRASINRQISDTLSLSLGHIFRQLCVDFKQYKQKYNDRSDADYCDNEMKILMSRFIEERFQGAQRDPEPQNLVHIQSISNVGSFLALPHLQQIIRRSNSKLTLTKAIYALYKIGRNYPTEVRNLVQPIVKDRTKPSEVRQAAITVLLSTNPKTYVWTGLASSMWNEPNRQVVAFVYSALKSYADPGQGERRIMSQKARRSLIFLSKVSRGWAYSKKGNIDSSFFSQFLPKTEGRFSYITSSQYPLPKTLYFSVNEMNDDGADRLSKLLVNSRGSKQIINDLMSLFQDGKIDNFKPQRLWERVPKTMRAVSEQLNMHMSHTAMPPVLSVYTSLRNSMDRMFQMDAGDYDAFKHWLENDSSLKISPEPKMMYLKDNVVVVPSETGIPVVYKEKTPLVVSARGDLDVKFDFIQGKYTISFNKMKPILSINTHKSATFFSPISDKIFEGGVDESFQISEQLDAKIHLDTQTQRIEASIKLDSPCPLSGGEECHHLVHQHRIPFTKLANIDQCDSVLSCSPFHNKQMSQSQPGKDTDNFIKPVVHVYSTKQSLDGEYLAGKENDQQNSYKKQFYHTDVYLTGVDEGDAPSKIDTTLLWMDDSFDPSHRPNVQGGKHKPSVVEKGLQIKRIMGEMSRSLSTEHESWGVGMVTTVTTRNFNQRQYSASMCHSRESGQKQQKNSKLWIEFFDEVICMKATTTSSEPINAFDLNAAYKSTVQTSYGLGQFTDCQEIVPIFTVTLSSRPFLTNYEELDSENTQDYRIRQSHQQHQQQSQLNQRHHNQSSTWQHRSQWMTDEDRRTKVKQSRECLSQQQDGEPLSDSCFQLKNDLSAVRHVEIKLHQQSIAGGAIPFDLLIKNLGMEYLRGYMEDAGYKESDYNKQQQNTDILVKVFYNDPVEINIQVDTPRSEQSFLIPCSMDKEGAQQMTALHSSFQEKIRNVLYGPRRTTCTLGRNWLRTFDGVHLPVPTNFGGKSEVGRVRGREVCSVVLAQCFSCSQKFVITAGGGSDSRYVTVATTDHQITLVKRSQMRSVTPQLAAPVDIYVDEKKQELTGNNENAQESTGHIKITSGEENDDSESETISISNKQDTVTVRLPKQGVSVKLEGKSGRVQLHVNPLVYGSCGAGGGRGSGGCGLCGDMDGETVAEMTDAVGCVHTDTSTLWASYRVDTGPTPRGSTRYLSDDRPGECRPQQLPTSVCARRDDLYVDF